MSGATAFYYWEMMGHDYQINDGVKPYLVMQILQQMNEAFPPGTQILWTSPSKPSVSWVAGRTPAGDISVHMVSSSATEQARITGLPNGEYDLIVSTREEFGKIVQAYQVTDGTLLFELPGFSVTLLKTHH